LFSFFRKKSYSASDQKLVTYLHNLFGFSLKNLNLYKQALRHKSVAQNVKEGVKDSNERLEYLGDAVLGAVVAEYLFKRFPFKDEGFLTKMRSRIVSRESLGNLSRKMGLYDFVEKSKHDVNRSIHGDTFEALIGAIYLDQGYNNTRTVIVEKIINPHIDVDWLENNDADFKSQMIEWAQRNHKRIEFIVAEEAGNNHHKTYTINLVAAGEILGTGKGTSKKRAEQMAAEAALKQVTALES
jgi:ribonuclease III